MLHRDGLYFVADYPGHSSFALRLTWFMLWNWSVVLELILAALSSSSWAKLGKSNQFNSHRDQRKPKFYVLCLLGLHHILKTMRFETASLLDHRLRQSMWKCCHNVLYPSVLYVTACACGRSLEKKLLSSTTFVKIGKIVLCGNWAIFFQHPHTHKHDYIIIW